MARRSHVSKSGSKRMFRKSASKTHRDNLMPAGKFVMRGGIRK